MGRVSEAALAYGHILGGGNSDLYIANIADEDDERYDDQLEVFPWYNNGDGLGESIEQALGFGFFARDFVGEPAVDLAILYAGTHDITTTALVVKASLSEVQWGADYVDPICPPGADERLAWALDTLGIKLKQPNAGWVLGSFYG